MNEVVLSYNDSLLRKSDLKLLEIGNWMNDTLIGFMFEYYQYELFNQYTDIIYFLHPDVVQLMKLVAVSEAKEILNSLNLSSKKWIFLPINDNGDATLAGGRHWSLLLWDRTTSTCEHYDSCRCSNENAAKQTCSKICEVFSEKVKFCSVPVAPQTNGSDCGIYVMKIAENLCHARLNDEVWNPMHLTSEIITAEREKIKEIVSKLSLS